MLQAWVFAKRPSHWTDKRIKLIQVINW